MKVLNVNLLAGKQERATQPTPKIYRNNDMFEDVLRTKFDLASTHGEYKLWRPKNISYIYVRVYKNGTIRVYLFGNFDTYRVLGADKTVDSVSTDGDILVNVLKDLSK